MRRKRTKLEEELIKKGWELEHKSYMGKHSDKVFQYVYEKVYVNEYERNDGKVIVSTMSAYVYLDSKRNKVDNITISVPSGYTMFDRLSLLFLFGKIKEVEKEVMECVPKQVDRYVVEDTDEVVQVAEAVECNE